MKYLTITLLLLTSSLIIKAQDNSKSNFEWILGEWERTNNQPNEMTTESWHKTIDGIFQGFGVTMQNGDTVFYENMSIGKVENEYQLTVTTPMNIEPVHFQITSSTKTSFTAENPKNDYPKIITYLKVGEDIKATISGGGEAVDYLFVKVKD